MPYLNIGTSIKDIRTTIQNISNRINIKQMIIELVVEFPSSFIVQNTFEL